MLQVVNSVPFVPNQAELEDKGRTPVRARLVVATTNCKELNAFHYFHCPLAIQRRLPWVITLHVKPECAKNEIFLDSSKTGGLREGGYPNYWTIQVDRVVPANNNTENQQAAFESTAIFDDVYDFIQWYSREAMAFEEDQSIVDDSDKQMRDCEVCKTCFLPKCRCECMPAQSFHLFVQAQSFVSYVFFSYLNFCMNLHLFVLMFGWLCKWPRFAYFIEREMAFMSQRAVQQAFYRLGSRVHRNIGRFNLFLTICSVIGLLLNLRRIFKWVQGEPTMEEQGNNISKTLGSVPVADDKRENVWYNDNFVCTPLDVPARGVSWTKSEPQQLCDRLARNVVTLQVCRETDQGTMMRIGKGLVVSGSTVLTNNHTLSTLSELQVTVTTGRAAHGVCPKISFKLHQCDIKRFPEKDIAVFELRSLPPFSNLQDLFVSEKFTCIGKGFIIKRNEAGDANIHTLSAVQKAISQVAQLGNIPTWRGRVTEPTEVGDCGSPWLVHNGSGYFIAGLHVAGLKDQAACIPVTKEFLEQLTLITVEPSRPKISSETVPMDVQSLHFKSPFRYIMAGCATVYGSLTPGRRISGKSNVQESKLAPLAKEAGYSTNLTAPMMRGWLPWRNAIKELVNPVTDFKFSLLQKVRQEFTNDILRDLPADQLAELKVYDMFTSVNGANGVRFVDKMNRSTSMGHPWRKSKKHFMSEIPPTETCHDPIEFTPEIYARVEECLQSYRQNVRYSPVFAGSLKDEPRSEAKALSGQTRMFCASPADWNIVVRMHFLSFIRVLQNNRFIFESGPGTVAQSKEWHDIREYLTTFGGERMIAGDYKAFDKRMPPAFILEAFELIRTVCERSGNFSSDDLDVIRCVAYDTAYPIVDVNGDLVQFYGSNPSGHPLTVIINGIVNCLYVRYAYAELSGTGSAQDFKDHVKLMTYGDDNAMGCSDAIPWFTHTTLANKLAEIGVVYTMADKTAASIPYISIDDVSFLKRVWRFDEDLGYYVCPIEEASIAKMLIMTIPSKTVCEEAQNIAVLSTVVREYFWYGRQVFEEKRKMCMRFASSAKLSMYVTKSTFPSWENLANAYFRASDLPCLDIEETEEECVDFGISEEFLA